jgi:hypothetical protein
LQDDVYCRQADYGTVKAGVIGPFNIVQSHDPSGCVCYWWGLLVRIVNQQIPIIIVLAKHQNQILDRKAGEYSFDLLYFFKWQGLHEKSRLQR